MEAWLAQLISDMASVRPVIRLLTTIGDSDVSTILTWDAMFYETRVFGGALDGEMDRYATEEEATRGHAAMVERVKAAQAR